MKSTTLASLAALALLGLTAGCSGDEQTSPDIGFLIDEAGVHVTDAGDVDMLDAEPGHDASADSGAAEDARARDATLADVGALDAGSADTGPTDTGPTDTGPTDATLADVGALDAESADASLLDAGAFDTGPADTGVPDGGLLYSSCNATHLSGLGDAVTPGGHVDVTGFSAAGATSLTVMLHLRHATPSGGGFGGPLIRNVPFMQWGPGGSVLLARIEPNERGDFRVYFPNQGTPFVTGEMLWDTPVQWVFVFDGGSTTAQPARLFRWAEGENNGLVEVGTLGDYGGGNVPYPTVLPASTEPFRVGGGASPSHPDLDGDIYSFAIWSRALTPAQVSELNSGAAVVDPRNVSVAPTLFFPAEEPPGAPELMDVISGARATFMAGMGTVGPLTATAPVQIATGNCP